MLLLVLGCDAVIAVIVDAIRVTKVQALLLVMLCCCCSAWAVGGNDGGLQGLCIA